jgi:hypothetical protein
MKPEIHLARDAVTAAERNALAIAARRGDLVRVVRGVYVPAGSWGALDARGRARIRSRCVLSAGSGGVLSHHAAACEWGLPWIGERPHRVDLLSAHGRSTAEVLRHREDVDEAATVDGVAVTSIARTVIDVARTAPFPCAIAVADAALSPSQSAAAGRAPVSREQLESELARVPRFHGDVRARVVVSSADAAAGSPGESVSRWSMFRAGIRPPMLQHRFANPHGGSWFVDFWWPDVRIVGEFDGRSKYIDPLLRDGRSAEDVVYAEKRREDAIRRTVNGFVRWDFAMALSPAKLAAHLRASGVPMA